MKTHNRNALLVTFFGTLLILGMGYLGIVQGGRLMLHSDSAPEQAKYEDTSSNVFYGKIEDDIELFPWNYYSEDGRYGIPKFGMFYVESKVMLEQTFLNLIVENIDIPFEVVAKYYAEKPIVENMRMGENDRQISYYFFQDTPEFYGTKYQIKIACDNWSIRSVLCNKVRSEEIQSTEKWGNGKEALTKMLEKNREKLEEQIEMFFQLDSGYMGGGIYSQGSQIVFGILNSMVAGDMEMYHMWIEEMKKYVEENSDAYEEEYSMESTGGFSYQILERSDVILLLLQSDSLTIGMYYDPISMKFCGYNHFIKEL